MLTYFSLYKFVDKKHKLKSLPPKTNMIQKMNELFFLQCKKYLITKKVMEISTKVL